MLQSWNAPNAVVASDISYYYAGSQRIAMRTGNEPYLLFGDHLGSTSVVLDASGQVVEKGYYFPWGGTRGDETITSTDYAYTGQKREGDIYYYGARWPKVPEAKPKGFDPDIGRFMQADTIVPLQVQGTQAFDRYAYINNNPVNGTDPTGQSAKWISDFLLGFGTEFVRTNSWLGVVLTPSQTRWDGPSSSESEAMLVGRIVADIATIAAGGYAIEAGIGISGGGAVVGCGATLCLASAPAVAVGGVVVTTGIATTLSGAAALVENLSLFSRRGQNHLNPDPEATGSHSTFKRDPITGEVTHYETYEPQTNPRDPKPWSTILRYDGIGKSHRGILPPHIHDFINDIVRKAFPYEIPK